MTTTTPPISLPGHRLSRLIQLSSMSYIMVAACQCGEAKYKGTRMEVRAAHEAHKRALVEK